MEKNFIRDIYYTLQGQMVVPVPGVKNAFESGSHCEQSYNEMLEAYERLCQRLGVQSEDRDVEIIIHSLMSITDELCYAMYEYGAKFGHQAESRA